MAVKTTNLTEFTLNRAILKMALPASGAMLIQSFYYLVDIFWIGKLGAVAMAAASATSFFIWIAFSLADLSGIAANTLAAQSVGAGTPEEVRGHLKNTLFVSLLTSISMMAVGMALLPYMFVWLGLEPDVVADSKEYFFVWLLGLPLIFFCIPINAIFRGTGDTFTPLVLWGSLVAFNAVLDPLLIFGIGPFPRLNLAGAALATVICHALFLFIGAVILRKRNLWPKVLSKSFFAVTLSDIRQIMSIGLPIALNGALFSAVYIGLTKIIAEFGSVSVAAIGVGHRMESFPWFMSYGFGIAAASLVGQYMGAGKPQEAEKAVWRSCIIVAGFVAIFVAGIMLGAEHIVRFFIDDEAVIAAASVYLRISASCWMIGLLEVVVEGGFSGTGNTIPPLVIGVTLTTLRIPLAWFLAIELEWGPTGVWWAIGSTMIAKGLLIAWWFKRGKWKKTKLRLAVGSG